MLDPRIFKIEECTQKSLQRLKYGGNGIITNKLNSKQKN